MIGSHIWWDHLRLFLACHAFRCHPPFLATFHPLSHTYWTEISIFMDICDANVLCLGEIQHNKTNGCSFCGWYCCFVDSDALDMACQKPTYFCCLLKRAHPEQQKLRGDFVPKLIWNSKQQQIKSVVSIIFMFQGKKLWEHMCYLGIHITWYLIQTNFFIVIYNLVLCKNLFVAYGNISVNISLYRNAVKLLTAILFYSFHLEKRIPNEFGFF